jgi:hypothetical protein
LAQAAWEKCTRLATRGWRTVAIKVSDEHFSGRFEKSDLDAESPNICQYDVGPNYLVMEFVDGSLCRPRFFAQTSTWQCRLPTV